jgi:hypothetical protein
VDALPRTGRLSARGPGRRLTVLIALVAIQLTGNSAMAMTDGGDAVEVGSTWLLRGSWQDAAHHAAAAEARAWAKREREALETRAAPDPQVPGTLDPGIERLEGLESGGRSPFSLLAGDSFRPDDVMARGWTLLAQGGTVLADTDGAKGTSAGPDWPGIGRDTALFIVAQTASVAVLYALPGDVNRWSSKEVSLDRWWEHVRHPVWDNDPWGTNYISHPYWGATYYIRARERGFGKLAAFGYSALLSTIYEYGAEAIFEPPSGQDLMVTPILGSLVGAFIFEPIRDMIKGKPELRWYDHALLIATDPLGLLSSVVEVMLGIKSEILLRPGAPAPADLGPAGTLAGRKGERTRPRLGMTIDLTW